ncbi:MAG: hypothetical protein LBL80_00455 [Ruminococcus sp.]|jgi:hypothetical protein|nr:hypothetical protein [Ruminococcus sp.]
MKKRFFAILAMVCLTLILLTACGGLSGTYIYVGDSYGILGSELEFDGNEMKWGYSVTKYKIKGDEFRLVDSISEIRFSYSKKGDSIFIDENEYAKEGSDRHKEWEDEQE